MSRNKKISDPSTDVAIQKRRVMEVEIHGLLLAIFGLVLFLSLVAFDHADLSEPTGSDQISNFMGMFGARLADISITAFGVISYVIALATVWIGVRAILRRPFQITVLGVIAPTTGILFAAVLIHVFFPGYLVFEHYMPGGEVGGGFGEILQSLFARSGTITIAAIGLGLAVLYLAGITVRSALRFTGRNIKSGTARAISGVRESAARRREIAEVKKAERHAKDEVSVVAAVDLEPVNGGATAADVVELDVTLNERPTPQTLTPQPAEEPVPIIIRPAIRPDEPAWAAPSKVVPSIEPPTDDQSPPEFIPAPPVEEEDAVTKFDIVGPGDMERRHEKPPIVIRSHAADVRTAHVAPVPARDRTPDEPPPDPRPGTVVAQVIEQTPDDAVAAVEQIAPVAPVSGNARAVATRGATELSGPAIIVNKREKARVQEDLPLPPATRGPWQAPSLSLLDYVPPAQREIDQEFLRSNAEKLEAKLLDYKVQGKVVGIHPGPVVTMYEFLPAAGVRISQIANLADDLTMALKATSIRIVAPIPGKGVVGIEVPNKVRETVYLREILASDEFTKSKSKLTIALGKDIFGNPVVTDLARMPHLLIAGATGSGKSVAVNAFILSLLRNATPEEVRIILVDPKVVELNVYEDIPHLLLPVVCDPKQAAAALRWACEEMDRRYSLLARFAARNIASFNMRVEKLIQLKNGAAAHPADDEMDGAGTLDPDEFDLDELEKLPYIVIVLDEFADLMMVASKDVEAAVTRLAQKARAAGIHLVMATQRPSKEVITGLIKSNFPSRIGFRVSSSIDSRIILDQSGAEALLGYGDMLFLKPGTSALERVHGSFVSDDEVMRVVNHLKTQGEPDYQLDIIKDADEVEIDNEEDDDPLTDEAQDIVLESGKASISFLQRRLKIGYNRSARIMESLERRRVVGPPDSRGERKVLLL